jgi:hypothetical protein
MWGGVVPKLGDLDGEISGEDLGRGVRETSARQTRNEMLGYPVDMETAGLRGCRFGATPSPGYSKCSSAARLTAARRLVTLSLL